MSNIHNIAFLVGRVIAASFFLMNGFNHFAQLNMMTGYAKSKGIPAVRRGRKASGLRRRHGDRQRGCRQANALRARAPSNPSS